MPGKSNPQTLPPQQQPRQPGMQGDMHPEPRSTGPDYRAAGKLEGRCAIVTGGDSGIGRAVAVAFAKEGADILFTYLDETADAEETRRLVTQAGRRCVGMAGDLGSESHCREVVRRAMEEFGRIDVLVNNAGEQHPRQALEDIDSAQLERTFRTNFFGMFNLSREALPHMASGGAIVNTTSVTAYRGSSHLIDYAATKGAIVAFTRSLSSAVVERGIRVNAVAPGPIWTPLIPASFSAEEVSTFGSQVPMKRPGQPEEVAPCYVFLASDDASYMTGQVLHPNGGEIING
ncbi:SDR family oxidoreductase [Pigmentiphaga kullae]|uniref:NAD(P)-dependent dehydrogenase (Short-subunit alcohol dehydrogenase family) n=1 Tax=Pigmentiphaga kullae TaxID=151784 RepID=A0A4Q7NCF8_9BURK|nr:SDR family oxidoreductase [Pigmentiphaga kullae]RZS80307.1 NAD(P)-dependent dehydrogenase (short-subunit alcohol dehydrogenase family) [Pigmentiphaga kullae]